MVVGVLTLELHLPASNSLKAKRSVLNHVKERIRTRFNVSVAEVDHNDSWQLAGVAICCVSNSARHADEMLTKVVKFIAGSRLDAELLDYEMEMLQAL